MRRTRTRRIRTRRGGDIMASTSAPAATPVPVVSTPATASAAPTEKKWYNPMTWGSGRRRRTRKGRRYSRK